MQDELRKAGPPAGSAMQRAVAAEQEALRAIDEARAQAQARIERARTRARAVLDKVPSRIARLNERRARTVQQALARIEAEEAQAIGELRAAAIPPEVLEATVQKVIGWLTGADPERSA